MNKLVQFDQNFYLKKEGIIKNISYERSVYESVDVIAIRCVKIPNRTENTEAATEAAKEYQNAKTATKCQIGLLFQYLNVRIPNRTVQTVRKNTESDREYQSGHQIGPRIPKRPPNRPENTETATEIDRIGSRIPNQPSISVFKCENTESDGPTNSQVISPT